ncbi:MAG: NlpC/P60 family protein [Mangrovicoccus sp.]|nr:NlpC/P60 family protein [Mangrovicoccus sp.]
MSPRGEKIVAAARGWIGTPYHHQAALKGVGCDCLGLICGLWAEMIGPLPRKIPAYTPDWAEPEGRELLWEAARALLAEKPLSEVAPGDVILFRMREGHLAKHLGLMAQLGTAPSFIHAYQGHGVVESPLSSPWRKRIIGCFAFPL